MADRRGIRGLTPARLRDRGGFALALAVFALVLLAAVVAGGYFSASQEFQIGRGMRSLASGFYASEAGIREVVNTWDPLVAGNLQPSESLLVGPVTLEGGGGYTAKVMRFGSNTDSMKRYFYIETSGRPPGRTLGERRQAAVARARYPRLCCDAAAKVATSVESGGGSATILDGFNTTPTSWPASACAGMPAGNAPGVIVVRADSVERPNRVKGDPVNIAVDSALTAANVFDFTDISYAELVALADHTFSSLNFGNSVPSLDANGRCDRTKPLNWGAPDSPGHPCFNYFPIIHVSGDLHLNGSGRAQGILVVGGDLLITGPFDFYGILLVGDDLKISGPTQVYGGAMVVGDAVFTGVNSTVRLSRCAVRRAERLSNLTRPRILSRRGWVELF